VSVFLSDPVLAFALLRFIRTTGLKVAKDVVGIRQGLALMGLSTLRLWAENMLDFAPPAADETRRLATSAMDRGRLMVALTLHQEQHSAEHQEWAYAVGFMSVLEQALGVSMSNVVQALQLPVVPAQALVRRVGSLGMLLSLAVAAESGDYEIVEQIAPRMGMTRAVVLEHLRDVQRIGGRDNSRASLA
jgi:c-di-GMP-related signal transduction protein